jgi:hypothetical protein
MTAAEVNGYLHYKRLGKLKDAIYANYNNDRVVSMRMIDRARILSVLYVTSFSLH